MKISLCINPNKVNFGDQIGAVSRISKVVSQLIINHNSKKSN